MDCSCGVTTFITESVQDIFILQGAGTDTLELNILDTISQSYGNMDGSSFCGERSYSLTSNPSWLAIDDGELQITSG